MDPRWSETGDRYIIKLFRDYVYHQVDENGVPVVDMAHVLTCLNKVRNEMNIDIEIIIIKNSVSHYFIIIVN
jgi:PAB-dependent poly(A)-specific ribonuclease subunit 3